MQYEIIPGPGSEVAVVVPCHFQEEGLGVATTLAPSALVGAKADVRNTLVRELLPSRTPREEGRKPKRA